MTSQKMLELMDRLIQSEERLINLTNELTELTKQLSTKIDKEFEYKKSVVCNDIYRRASRGEFSLQGVRPEDWLSREEILAKFNEMRDKEYRKELNVVGSSADYSDRPRQMLAYRSEEAKIWYEAELRHKYYGVKNPNQRPTGKIFINVSANPEY